MLLEAVKVALGIESLETYPLSQFTEVFLGNVGQNKNLPGYCKKEERSLILEEKSKESKK